MPYCSDCGKEVNQGAAFCSGCGNSLGDDGASKGESEQPVVNPDVSDSSSEETNSAESPSVNTEKAQDEGRDYGRIGKAVAFALIPAFIAYMLLSLASGGDPVGLVFIIALPVFGYLIYQREGTKAMAGGMCYYLAIEFLLSPFMFLLYTFAFASQNTTTDAGAAGAAIGGFALTIGAFVIGLPLALALYLVSGRLDSGGEAAA